MKAWIEAYWLYVVVGCAIFQLGLCLGAWLASTN